MIKCGITGYAICTICCTLLIAQRIDEGKIFHPSDSVRMAEAQQQAQLDLVRQHDRELKLRQENEKREFEGRFNDLIKAVSSFVDQYNGGKGNVWPKREADKLAKAMRSLEKSLGSYRPPAPGTKTLEFTRE
jgi:hypothetical protein